MKKPNITKFDRAGFFGTDIKPELDRAASLCREHGVPFFYTACVKNSADASEYVWDAVTPESLGLSLCKDMIWKHICVANGDEAVPSLGEDVEMTLNKKPVDGIREKPVELTAFDKRDFFEKEVCRILRPLTARCGIYKIPFFYTACVENPADISIGYVSNVISPYSREVTLYDDRISRHIDVSVGFAIIHTRTAVGSNVRDLVDGNEMDGDEFDDSMFDDLFAEPSERFDYGEEF